MSLHTPTSAPFAHIEVLPERSIAAEAEALPTTGARTQAASDFFIKISTWSPGLGTMYGYGEEEDADDWAENNCSSCRWHEEQIEWDADDQEVETSEGPMQLVGTYYTTSPCPCYDDGVSSVSFPCTEGLDGPSENTDEVDLITSQMKYTIDINVYTDGSYFPKITYAMQQGCVVNDGQVFIGDLRESVNTYSIDNHICWNDNSEGNSLCEVEAAYTTSDANEDLCSFDAHQNNAMRCRDEEKEMAAPKAIQTPDSADNLGKGLAIAHAQTHTSAFMLLASNGAVINGSVAYQPVYMYPQVAVDDDTILNVWATDVMPTNKRLLFTTIKNEDEDFQTLLLGAVDQNFNLSSCKSLPVTSSEQAARDSNLSPA